ncbi:TIGR01777 family oxidoreductase [Pseudotenacibaculum sp. MALMAid0570]|uniref:TIGR01777 family oxidoreductase n=1 Tax=Pseudotenacibaculum sp. MALMAid0570 TaxID=3143938 RepID=UPI0032DE8134
MQKVLITGGTGLIGKHLCVFLKTKGYEVRLLSRNQNLNSEYETFIWNIDKQIIDEKAFENLDYIIHLAGAGIADKRWSKKRKEEIVRSRIQSTELLYKTVKKLQTPLKAFISSSAIGYYGAISSDTIFKEDDKAGDDFISNVCQLWEKAAFQFQQESIRTVAIRTGIVLSKKGGALSKMKTPIVTPIGSGKQYMPWIHMNDLCEIYRKALEDINMTGVYNGVAPEHQTNASFSKLLAKFINRPFLSIAIPAFILKILFGEMAAILIYGSRISSQKIQDVGFSFTYPKFDDALKNLNQNEI